MIFDETIEYDHKEAYGKVVYRKAVRAIILRDGKLLMVHSNRGDYKFPGGGINPKESEEEALKREVEEETGYLVKDIKEMLGRIIENSEDEFTEDALFQMESCYYVCEVKQERTSQNLDDYEEKLDFKPEWITVSEALAANLALLESDKKISWLKRETEVLKRLAML